VQVLTAAFYLAMLIHILMCTLAVMNHAAASGTTSSPQVSSSTNLMANSQRPASNESVPPTDRSTIYRSHDYEELPTSRFLYFKSATVFVDKMFISTVLMYF